MNLRTMACVVALAYGIGAPSARAVTLYESATMGTPGGFSGPILADAQFLGARFTLTDTVDVTAVGGHINNSFETLFAAIVSLSGALPSGSPFDGTTLASTTFSSSSPSADISTPLSVTLGPGTYALILAAAANSGRPGVARCQQITPTFRELHISSGTAIPGLTAGSATLASLYTAMSPLFRSQVL